MLWVSYCGYHMRNNAKMRSTGAFSNVYPFKIFFALFWNPNDLLLHISD